MACRELWTNDDPRFDGKYVKFANVLFEPQPVQKPHPPIWVGGESGPALRRTARLGDGWYPIGTNPQHRLDTMKRFQGGVEQAAPADPRGRARPGEDRPRLPRHAAGANRSRRAPTTASAGCSPARPRDRRRSAGVPRFRRRPCRFQLRRRHRRRHDRQHAPLPRGRAGKGLRFHLRREDREETSHCRVRGGQRPTRQSSVADRGLPCADCLCRDARNDMLSVHLL